MSTQKFEFVPGDEITIAPGRTLKRIRALVSIGALVSPGDVGGYVESAAQVSGNAWALLTVGPLGSRNSILTVHTDKKIGIRYTTGCFSGSRTEFLAAIERTHGDSAHGNAYAAAVLLAGHLVDAPAK